MKRSFVVPLLGASLSLLVTFSSILPESIVLKAAANLSELQKNYETALAQYNKGSIGFYESLKDKDADAKEAYEIMTDLNGTHQYRDDENIRPYTDPSDPLDAASLENMKSAIEFIEEANRFRSNDNTLGPVSALYVTHTLMAISQLSCNRSSQEYIHARAYNIGENLAWGYDDPFDDWYTAERQMYKDGDRSVEVAHYENIMDPEYETTGFAMTEHANQNICHEQSFQYESDLAKSVSSYKQLFMDYYTKTVNTLDQAEAELKQAKAIAQNTGTFSDVSKSAWYYEYCERASQIGLMTGTSESEFSPNGTMSRAMAVTVLYRMAGSPETSGNAGFTDVKSGLWYSKPISWAVENEIASGYNSKTFGPDDMISREQLCVLIHRFLSYEGLKVSARADLSSFKDASSISSYAKDSVAYCVAVGIISGAENGTKINPSSSATRAECAKMFLNAYDLFA